MHYLLQQHPATVAGTRYHYTREEWLHQAAGLLASERFAPAGFTVPPINLSVGIPYRARAFNKGTDIIGQCWHEAAATNGLCSLFLSPTLGEAVRVIGVLAHELVHATIGNAAGHKKPFADCATAIGLTGPWTATGESEDFKAWADTVIARLGPYPHARLMMPGDPDYKAPERKPGDPDAGPLGPTGSPKQSTRLLKAECPSCGCVIRITKFWADKALPRCGCPDHKRFILAGETASKPEPIPA